MPLIRRLILKEWSRFFLSAFLVLFLLLTTANLISGFLRGNVTSLEVLQNYFLEVPGFIGKILPLACLVGSLFSLNKLINRNELTAIMAGGYSRRKVIFDLVLISSMISIFQLVNMGYVKPYIKSKKNVIIGDNAHKFRNLSKKGIATSSVGSGKVWYKSKKYFFSFVAFDKKNNILTDISIFKIDTSYLLDEKITATRAVHIEGDRWKLENVVFLKGFSKKDSFPQIIEEKEFIINLQETPEEFRKIESDITNLSMRGLWNYIKTLKESGINTTEYEVILFEIISSATICILFAIIGALSVFNPNRRASSFGKNVTFIFIFSIFYWLIYSYSLELGRNSKMNPILATFSIPILCSFFLSFIFYRHRKLT